VGDLESGGGIVVPEALRPYMPRKWKTFIPFTKPKPPTPEEEAARKAAEAAASKGQKKGKAGKSD
jgi:hypothetical protein